MLLMGFFDAGVVRVESVSHTKNLVILKTKPTIGSNGTIGQRMMSIKLKIPPSKMMTLPASKIIRREKNPTIRETRRSINI